MPMIRTYLYMRGPSREIHIPCVFYAIWNARFIALRMMAANMIVYLLDLQVSSISIQQHQHTEVPETSLHRVYDPSPEHQHEVPETSLHEVSDSIHEHLHNEVPDTSLHELYDPSPEHLHEVIETGLQQHNVIGAASGHNGVQSIQEHELSDRTV